jgi:hypothetical protein
MEATYSFETSFDFHPTTQRYMPEDRILHNHCCENLKSYNINIRSGNLKGRDRFGVLEEDMWAAC